jgi:glycosyltransferase involved in cell wall biosynthesis
MKIGFDAKRLVYNLTGLGNYSRTVVNSLSEFYPQNQYLLYTPGIQPNPRLDSLRAQSNITIKTPKGIFGKAFGSVWRTYSLANLADSDSLDIFHGLSNELPSGIRRKRFQAIVTIHDLIFMRYPNLYSWVDRRIYERKTRYACMNASRIVAVSEQTKSDLVEFLGLEPRQVEVIYQSCDPLFAVQLSESDRSQVRKKYQLPSEFILYVGSIEERKNLLGLLKAIKVLERKMKVNLVALGNGGRYLNIVRQFIAENGLKERVVIHSGVAFSDFPAIYQSASLFVYPSFFEGFGIPIIEALWSRIPVITSTGSCFAEAGGSGSFYVEPGNAEALADTMQKVLEDSEVRSTMIEKGLSHVQQFKTQVTAAKMMGLYEKVRAGTG